MVSNLPTSLDNLTSNGVINFDAEAYIKGTHAKNIASPSYLPFEQPLNAFGSPGQAPTMHQGQPRQDEFVTKHESSAAPADWKKAATAVLIAGLAVFGGIKFKSKISALFAKKPPTAATTPTAANATTTTAATAATTATSHSIGSKIKDVISNFGEKIKNTFSKLWPKIKALPKWAKIATGAAAGLLALFAFSGHKTTANKTSTTAITPPTVAGPHQA